MTHSGGLTRLQEKRSISGIVTILTVRPAQCGGFFRSAVRDLVFQAHRLTVWAARLFRAFFLTPKDTTMRYALLLAGILLSGGVTMTEGGM